MHFGLRHPSHAVRLIRQAAAIAALALLAGCVPVGPAEDTSSVASVLKLNFSSWDPVATRDVLPALRDPWLAQHPKQDKMMVTGDYFGAGANSYAALITKKDKQGRRVRLVVLKPAESGRFETYILFTESPIDTMPTVTTSQANEYQVILAGQSVTVPVEGIVYKHADGREKLFFWNESRFTDIELVGDENVPPDTTQP